MVTTGKQHLRQAITDGLADIEADLARTARMRQEVTDAMVDAVIADGLGKFGITHPRLTDARIRSMRQDLEKAEHMDRFREGVAAELRRRLVLIEEAN